MNAPHSNLGQQVKSHGPELPPLTDPETWALMDDPAQGRYMRKLWITVLNQSIQDSLGRDSKSSREFFRVPMRRDLRTILENVGVDEDYFLTRFLPVLFKAWEMQDETGVVPRGVVVQENFRLLRQAQAELGL